MGLENKKSQNEDEKKREFKREVAEIFKKAEKAVVETFLRGWGARVVENQETKQE